MRRASTCLVALGLALLALPAVASASPKVTFKAEAVPISGFPHTGNILGAGAAVQAEYTISGTEYGGFAAAADWDQLLPPDGHEAPHDRVPDVLPKTVLEQVGARLSSAQRASAAGPVGTASAS